MRICSLLPSSTEIVYALGLGDDLVAVTHECDFPPDAATKPRITRSAVDSDRLSSREIDALVHDHLHDHRSIYHLDRDLLERLDPDLILTQELCDVCAVSYEAVKAAVRTLYGDRTILSLEPTRFREVIDTIGRVGEVTNRGDRARELAERLGREVDVITAAVADVERRPRVVCLEWLDPPWVGGHWIPEMVRLAGGEDPLGQEGSPSVRVDWQRVVEARPEVVILMPCGFDVDRAVAEFRPENLPTGWHDLPAVRNGQVYAVHANAYFSRPGPRLVEGLRILAGILHPERVALHKDATAWRRLDGNAGTART
ncbi:MAG TPA: cobalamin-binding protein [Dehalococcoidia bacterium]